MRRPLRENAVRNVQFAIAARGQPRVVRHHEQGFFPVARQA